MPETASKLPTVTIGISAYQCEENIEQLLSSLFLQEEKLVRIKNIIVYCDGCTDQTVNKAKQIKNRRGKKVVIIDSLTNKGYAHSVQSIINKSSSDFLILLNDDISIRSNKLIGHLITTFSKDRQIGFVCGDIQALDPTTFIGRCVKTSFDAFKLIRTAHRNGYSVYTADGKIMALRMEFAKNLDLNQTKIAGNVDIYIYFRAISTGWKYAFSPEAKIYCRLPETITDYRSQKIRAAKSRVMLREYFGRLVDTEFELPKKLYFVSTIRIFLKYPLEALLFKLLINNFYLLRGKNNFTKWKLASSTKKLLSAK